MALYPLTTAPTWLLCQGKGLQSVTLPPQQASSSPPCSALLQIKIPWADFTNTPLLNLSNLPDQLSSPLLLSTTSHHPTSGPLPRLFFPWEALLSPSPTTVRTPLSREDFLAALASTPAELDTYLPFPV